MLRLEVMIRRIALWLRTLLTEPSLLHAALGPVQRCLFCVFLLCPERISALLQLVVGFYVDTVLQRDFIAYLVVETSVGESIILLCLVLPAYILGHSPLLSCGPLRYTPFGVLVLRERVAHDVDFDVLGSPHQHE